MTTIEKIIEYSPKNKPEVFSLWNLIKKKKHLKALKLYVPFGITQDDQELWLDFQELGSLLLVGNAGAGKTSFIKAIITTLISKNSPKEIKFLFSTAKPHDYVMFNKSRYLFSPIISKTERLIIKLEELVVEMDRRFEILTKARQTNITWYNREYKKSPMQYTFVIMDNFSELVEACPKALKKRLETSLVRLLQMARAVGIYIIFASKQINGRVLPGWIFANFSNKIGFRTATKKDSRDLLYYNGCETLLGKGDAIISHYGNGGVMLRIQTPYITDEELIKLIK